MKGEGGGGDQGSGFKGLFEYPISNKEFPMSKWAVALIEVPAECSGLAVLRIVDGKK